MDVSRLVTALLLDVVLYVITHFKFNPVFPLIIYIFPGPTRALCPHSNLTSEETAKGSFNF